MLPKLEGFATAVLGRLDATSLARVTATSNPSTPRFSRAPT